MSSSTHVLPDGHGPEAPRRDFLKLLTTAAAAVGVGAIVWPLIDSMNPAADVLAAGEPIDVDLGKLEPGQQIVVVWRGKPIFVVHRTPQALASLRSPQVLRLLSDPNSHVLQQPTYAENWHRSIKPEYAIMVGICTHLGCIPNYFPVPSATDPLPNWPGGYFCPCHGSKYDLAGRVWSGVPAPYNLPVPPYDLTTATTARIGQNPIGETFSLSTIVQI
jgi:ubiquinol-cytochrome c reductase iron-sulfur subunit